MHFEETIAVEGKDGTVLNVHRRPGSGRSIVFAHGGTSSSLIWNEIVLALPKDWDILSPDARGHGASGRAQTYRWDDFASDLNCIVQALNLTDPVLAGHSMGAAAVATYGSLYRDASCLIIEDPPWWLAKPLQDLRDLGVSWRGGVETLQKGTMEAHLGHWQEKRPHLSPDEHIVLVESERAVDLRIFEEIFDSMPDWRQVIPGIKCPSLLVCGDPSKGAIVTAEQALEIQKLNSMVEAVTISSAGHCLSLDAREEYLNCVLPFIQRHQSC